MSEHDAKNSGAAAVRQRFGALTAADVRALDAAAVAGGVDILLLMEVAGFQVARVVWDELHGEPGAVAVVVGRGNNGGDGLVAARHLAASGCVVSVQVLGAEASLVGALAGQLAAARGAGVTVRCDPNPAGVIEVVAAARITVDALLGTGLRTAPRAPEAAAIAAMLAGPPVVAIDVPSGMDADTGSAAGAVVRAATTVTLTAGKAGLWERAGRALAGRVLVADIGMPATAWAACGLTAPVAVRGGRVVEMPAPH